MKPLNPGMACVLIGIAALLGLTSGCVTFTAGGGRILHEEIEETISQPPLDQVNWGIRVVDPERGQVLFSRHSHLKFVPASNMKLLTTAAALRLLGPEYRYHTTLWGLGRRSLDGDTLMGDLVLTASGDPTLSDRFYPSAEAPLDSLAEGLWEAGIRTVTGSLVVDVSVWDSTTVPGTWEVEDLPATYAATGGAFSIGEGTLSVEIFAGQEEGAPATAHWWPQGSSDFLSAGFVTSPRGDTAGVQREVAYLPESHRIRVSGQIPAGEADTLHISQREPVRIASVALLEALNRRGIHVEGGLRIAWVPGEPVGTGGCVSGSLTGPASQNPSFPPIPMDSLRQSTRREVEICPDGVPLSELVSPPMTRIVQAVLEPSQNWMAEQLVRTLGSEFEGRGGWREGLRIERRFLTEEAGLDSLDIYLRDGSGLSAKNLVSPRGVVQLLDYMRNSPDGGAFRNALASPGEEGSTLENRLAGLENQVFAKTGTITHVASLSGYLYSGSGRLLIFSILANGTGLPSRDVRSGIDRIVRILARY